MFRKTRALARRVGARPELARAWNRIAKSDMWQKATLALAKRRLECEIRPLCEPARGLFGAKTEAIPFGEEEFEMRLHWFSLMGGVAALLIASGATAQEPLAKFSGTKSGETEEFTVKGPWLLDWRVESEFPDLATTVINLKNDADQTVDSVADFAGQGNGLKLFRQSGTFYVAVSIQNAKWSLEITEINEKWANRLEKMTQARVAGHPPARPPQKEVAAGTFKGWHADGDKAIILNGTGAMDFRVTFGGGSCPGLAKAKELSFVTPRKEGEEVYDSILLDDGTRCYFDKVEWISR